MKKYKRTLFNFSYLEYGDEHQEHPTCAFENCQEKAEFPAPKSRYNLRDFHYFCKDHARQYNEKWNFCIGMNDDEILDMLKKDELWDRPTRPFASSTFYYDNAEELSEKFSKFTDQNYDELRMKVYPDDVQEALQKFDLCPPLTYEDIKNTYKSLAKKFHPDLNQDKSKSENKLKMINEAYEVLKKNKNLWL